MFLTYILITAGCFLIVVFVIFLKTRTGGESVDSTLIKDSLLDESSFEVFEVQLSKNEEIGDISPTRASLAAESMFAALHGLLREKTVNQEYLSFEIVSSTSDGIRFYYTCPREIIKFVESQVYAQFPGAHVKAVADHAMRFKNTSKEYEIATIDFARPYFFPIKSFRDFEIDTMSALTSAISSVGDNEEIWYQFVVRPVADTWQKEGYDYVQKVRETGVATNVGNSLFGGFAKIMSKEFSEFVSGTATGLFQYKERVDDSRSAVKPQIKLQLSTEMELRAIENKLSHMGFEANVRVMATGTDHDRIGNNLRSALAVLKQYSSTANNAFIADRVSNKPHYLGIMCNRAMDEDKILLLNSEELATFFHFPSAAIDTPNIPWIYSRKSEPPADLPTDNCVYIGETTFRDKKVRFGLKNNDDRLRHLYVIGKSGTGKSSLFESMVAQDIASGAGVGVLDPHGETIERILDRIPDDRIDDVVYFDPSDTELPVGLNLLEIDDPSNKNLMASGLVDAINQHFDYSWGPRLEYLLNYAILTLLEVPGTNMLGITRLLEDKNYQNYILHFVKDPVVVKFWETEFKEMKGNQKLVTEAISPIQNKVNRFLASTTIRNILGQKKSTLDIWDAMNSGKILLMNLSKGKIGSDNANLLGALLVSRIQFYALQRAKIPYDDRRPFYLYVDEFQNFATGSFEEVLSESRKYKLGLYLTHQFTAQLPEELLKSVFGNVGTIMAFSLGAPDAKELANEFAPYFNAEDIISLERFQVYMKLMKDGMTSHPFSARILVPFEKDFLLQKTANREKVIQRSREKYGVPREYVESKINKWVEAKFDKGMAIAQEYKDKEGKNGSTTEIPLDKDVSGGQLI